LLDTSQLIRLTLTLPLHRSLPIILLSWLALCGCGSGVPEASAPAPPAKVQATPASVSAARPVIVALGDSLTAGAGVPPEQSYPAKLQVELDQRGLAYRVVNAGISGDTTAGGLDRLGSVLRLKPQWVIVELGANDGLRGLPIEATRANLAAIIERLQQAGTGVILAGMQIPPNYGPDYTRQFAALYPELARRYRAPLIDFFLDQVAARPELNLGDGIHPSPAGYRLVTENVLKVLLPLIQR
jgi:acyl-CoA thioesterase-1